MINHDLIVAASISALVALAGCDGAKPPAQVFADTATAEQHAQEENADAAREAADKMAKANDELREEQRDQAHEAAVQSQNMVLTDAQGAHKVALAQCKARSGDAKSACKKKADADLEAAKAGADQMRARQDPKP